MQWVMWLLAGSHGWLPLAGAASSWHLFHTHAWQLISSFSPISASLFLAVGELSSGCFKQSNCRTVAEPPPRRVVVLF